MGTPAPERSSRQLIAYVSPSGGEAIRAQRAAISGWADEHDVAVAEWHVEKSDSLAVEDRPALNDALRSARCRSARMIVARPESIDADPINRAIVEQLAKHLGAKIAYVEPSRPSAESRRILEALAAHEQMLLRLRMETAAELRKPRGKYWGRCPWGYRFSPDGMRLEPYEPEQNVIAVIHHMRVKGFKLREITAELARAGLVGRTGRPLSITRIYEILQLTPHRRI